MAYLAFGLLAGFGFVCLYVYENCFYSPKNRLEDPYERPTGEQYEAVADVICDCIRLLDKTPCQWVSTKSCDGLTLWGRYYFASSDAPTMIVFHGYRGNALRDGAASFSISNRLGFNVLIPDQRSHARSEGTAITFGVKERLDVLSWTEFVGGSKPIILSGLSMGAATVLMASDLKLPENTVCILADCPYDSPAAIIRKVCTDLRFPKSVVFPFIQWTARVLCGFDLLDASAIAAVKKTRLPILILHGEDDRFVPWEMSWHIATASPSPIELEIFPGAGHGLCYMTDPERYEKCVVQFLWRQEALAPYLQRSDFARSYRELSL